jgi:transposase
VSVARKAQENGINANLLRKWIGQYLLERERTPASTAPTELALEPETGSRQSSGVMPVAAMPSVAAATASSAFVPIVQTRPATAPASFFEPASPSMALRLHAQLPNGVQFDLGEANLETLSSVVQLLGRLPCSGSTKD